MAIFHDRLNELIKQKDITRNKLLMKLKLNKSSILMWEKRNSIPKQATLEKIADYFNVSTDYLLGKTDIAEITPITESDLTKSERELLEFYKKTEDSDKAHIKALVRAVDKLLGLDR